jgi:hypothetical protein
MNACVPRLQGAHSWRDLILAPACVAMSVTIADVSASFATDAPCSVLAVNSGCCSVS